MTATSQPTDFWSSFLPEPLPNQDTDLLRQVGFIPGLKELLMVRQVHALEHATVWILSGSAGAAIPDINFDQNETDTGNLGGLSTEQGFYLYGQVDASDVRRAAQEALTRMVGGEWNLAVHPRCGTNLSVGMLLTVSLAFGMHLLLPRGPIEQLLGLGFAASTATQLTPELGRLVQQHLTTAVPFNLTIQNVAIAPDVWGRPTHFVQTVWIDPH
ncbi:DUF6391 domain-containing protein [Myxacorys almedinensis]|uniref:Uncharacterized protein n=1 Tax=Myxacorys almedinensis A TaxID=2690445 RepID=A0A8J7Z598_9CYAN|nr:DUF6391 domain-containing protein [Myxacorys almedinensis]NDJ16678.1 hypothetical protein [Myxacorys almedinensis A]